MPSLILPSQQFSQPQGAVSINWSNPLARDIIYCLPLNGSDREIVTWASLTYGASADPNYIDADSVSLKSSGNAACASIQLDLSAYNMVTVSFSMSWDVFANNDKLALEFSPSWTTNTGFAVNPNHSVYGKFLVALNGFSGSAKAKYGAFTRPTAGEWHHYMFHFALTNTSNEDFYAYVDGVKQTLTNKGLTATPVTNFGANTLYIFSRNNANYFGAGKIKNLIIRGGVVPDENLAMNEFINPWQIYEPDNQIFYFGAASGIDLSGDATASTTAAGTITESVSMSSAAIALATTSGIVNQSIDISGSAASVAVADGIATLSMTLSGDAYAEAFVSDNINLSVTLSGESIAQALASANLDAGAESGLSGDAQAISAASGALLMDLPIEGAASVTVTGSGGIASDQTLSGSAAVIVAGAGDLTINAVGLSGSALAEALAGGSVAMTMSFSADALAQALAQMINVSTFASSHLIEKYTLRPSRSYTLAANERNYTLAASA